MAATAKPRLDETGESAGARHLPRLVAALILVTVFLVVETVAAFATGSLALLSDAGHMLSDAGGLGMAVAAIVAARRAGRDGPRTFGLYRLEILAALANALLLFVVAGYVVVEAASRLGDPPEVVDGAMLIVAVTGLVVNVVAWAILRRGAAESLNVAGASLEVIADLIGSVGVIAAALLLRFADWQHADPLIAAAIGLFILPRAARLGRAALRILVQAAPPGLDLEELRSRLGALPGVVDVHDLHVWTLTSEMDVASIHIMVAPGTELHSALDRAQALLRNEYRIAHATLQVEPDTHEACAEVSW